MRFCRVALRRPCQEKERFYEIMILFNRSLVHIAIIYLQSLILELKYILATTPLEAYIST